MEINLDGIFRAKVLDNQDPYNQERLLVSVPGVHDPEVGVWAEHVSPSYNSSGDIPSVGSVVYITFIRDFNMECNPNDVVWLGISNYR